MSADLVLYLPRRLGRPLFITHQGTFGYLNAKRGRCKDTYTIGKSSPTLTFSESVDMADQFRGNVDDIGIITRKFKGKRYFEMNYVTYRPSPPRPSDARTSVRGAWYSPTVIAPLFLSSPRVLMASFLFFLSFSQTRSLAAF